jgi:hypothetical protein
MQFDARNVGAAPDREIEGRREQRKVGPRVWASLVAHNNAAKEHIARLAPAIDVDVIPLSAQVHRPPLPTVTAPPALPTAPADQIAGFVPPIMGHSESGIQESVGLAVGPFGLVLEPS